MQLKLPTHRGDDLHQPRRERDVQGVRTPRPRSRHRAVRARRRSIRELVPESRRPGRLRRNHRLHCESTAVREREHKSQRRRRRGWTILRPF